MSRQPIRKALEAELAAAEKAIAKAKATRDARNTLRASAIKRVSEADIDVKEAEGRRDRVLAAIQALTEGDGDVQDPDGARATD